MPERGAGAEPVLLERDDELQKIERALKAATGGSGSVVFVSGHAGEGKTVLLQVAIERARSLGLSVLTARGAETEQEFSFSVVLQLLEHRLATADPAERDEILNGAAALARPLFEGGGASETAGAETAFARFHGLYWVVSNLSERSPLLFVVDDVHWADAASMRFLLSLANRLDGLAVTLLLSRRLGERATDEGVIDAIAHAPAASRIDLRPLSPQAVAVLVRADYDASAQDAFCDACARAVRGNPLYLRELLSELRNRKIPADATGAGEVYSMDVDTLGRSVRWRLARAGGDATRLAEAASVSDGRMSLSQVAGLAEIEAGAAGELARSLAVADILEGPHEVRFVHPLVRNAVYVNIGEERRAMMHRRAAELLRDEGADPERIAGHLQLADARGEDWATGTLLAAAQSAVERAAPDAALVHLRRAMQEPPSDHLRPAVLAGLGLAELSVGDPSGTESIRRAVPLLPDAAQKARYLTIVSEIFFIRGLYAEAFETMRDLLPEVADSPEETTFLVAFLGSTSTITVQRDQRFAEQLPRLAENMQTDTAKTPAQRLVLGITAGMASLRATLPADRVRELATRALSMAAGEEIVGAMMQAPMALTHVDDFEASESVLDRSLEAARRRGLMHNFINASVMRAEPRYRAGRLSDAIADAEAVLEGARQGIAGFSPPARGVLALALLDRGDIDGAEDALGPADLSPWEGLVHVAILLHARGHVMLARNDPTAALAAFEAARNILDAAGATNPTFCSWRSGAALAKNALGDHDEARRLAGEEVAIVKAFGAPRAIGIALRAHGLVVGGAEGIELLKEAVEVLATSQARLEHARALTDLGAALRRAGFRSDAQGQLRLAMDIAASCEAAGLVDRARAELVAAGGRPRRERLSGTAALTAQERRIAEMASGGMSNREIAQALFLTRKTIETHLTSTYAKLGIRSRDELRDVFLSSA